MITEIEYDFQLALQKGDYYLGNAVINFYLKKMPTNDTDLFINSQAVAVADLQINDSVMPIDPASFQNQVIPLRPTNLVQGWNTVQLRYLTKYNKNSVGLHTFTDSSDQQQYLYSQFEAFHCFRVFPCFDQPDMKAKMSLITVSPTEWRTVGNERETRFELRNADNSGRHILERAGIEWFLQFYDNEDDVAIAEFAQTPRISTYLYAICAGPYQVFEDYDAMYVPQRIFVRQSMVQFLRAELMFGITKTTLDFYQKNFGARYPFSKVDHVLCPDYKYGAMENVGCITYADSIMCSEKHMSVPKLTFFCVVIQHELCHMWFGNLVTMQWWNDLWLNEAFATALSYKACSEGGLFVDDFKDEAWLHMSGYKRWGLAEDLMPSNHKIQADCPSTDTAESLIDGITYGKGSSMIKQLIFLMGWEVFCKGLKLYFKRHAWGNTTLPDFIGCMQTGFNEGRPDEVLDLNNWSQNWLQTKGVNKHSAEIEQAEGNYTKFVIRQEHCKNAEAIFREQRINIGFYDDEGALIEKVENVKIEAQELTVVEACNGKKVPAAVLLNCDDWGFGHFTMDDNAMKVFEEKLGNMQSKIDRAVVIGQLIAMMRQIQYPATRMPLIMNQLINETNQNLINALLGAFTMAQNTYLPPETVPRFNKETASFFLKKAKKDRETAELARFCIDSALAFVTSEDHLRQTADWILNKKVVIEGEEVDVELTPKQKYVIVKKYWASTHFNMDEKKALRDAALADDNSDDAGNVKKVLDWILPDAALKERLWAEIIDENSGSSLMEIRLKVQGFW